MEADGRMDGNCNTATRFLRVLSKFGAGCVRKTLKGMRESACCSPDLQKPDETAVDLASAST